MSHGPGNTSARKLVGLICEAGMLKRVERSGWSVLGIKDAESVAEHSFRCALIGYVLARMENVHPYRALLMCLFGDIQEARITDLHKMAQRYIDAEKAEDDSFREQVASLPAPIKRELQDMHKEYRKQSTSEALIARDADILECLIQAKEYEGEGFPQAALFMKKAPRFLKTRSARLLWREAKSMDLNAWWFKLSDFRR